MRASENEAMSYILTLGAECSAARSSLVDAPLSSAALGPFGLCCAWTIIGPAIISAAAQTNAFFHMMDAPSNQIYRQTTPLPGTLPLFATGLGRWVCLAVAGSKKLKLPDQL